MEYGHLYTYIILGPLLTIVTVIPWCLVIIAINQLILNTDFVLVIHLTKFIYNNSKKMLNFISDLVPGWNSVPF